MRIVRLWLDGYGRFAGRELELAPGLQIISGPNERGKSTLRSFIGDMLYGQKKSPLQRLYDDSNELRAPWHGNGEYGGRLVYLLDEGREFEVYRNFDRKNETIQIFDRTHGKEITNEFERLRNREPLFAEKHIGLSKEVFQSIATITHATLEDLGDTTSLNQIRERLLGLADSGDEGVSADTALQQLQARIGAIGQPMARTRPLPAARAKLSDLQKEHEQSRALRDEVAGLDAARREALEELDTLRTWHRNLELALEALEVREREQRLEEAEELAGRVAEATQRCFALSAARDFPLEDLPELQRAENLVTTARVQLERSEREREALQAELTAEVERLGPDVFHAPMQEIPEAIEERLGEYETKIVRLKERIEEIEHALARIRENGTEAHRQLGDLPDFSLLAPDPVDWITQAVSQFQIALQTREHEHGRLEELEDAVADAESELEPVSRLFDSHADFVADAREYQIKEQLFAEHEAQLNSRVDALGNFIRDEAAQISGFRIVAQVSFVALVICIAAAIIYNPWAYLVVGAISLTVLFFFGKLWMVRRTIRHAQGEQQQVQKELDRLRAEQKERRDGMQSLLAEANCETLRELEALYDRIQEQSSSLRTQKAALEAQEKRVEDVDRNAAALLHKLKEAFATAGETIGTEAEVKEAAGRAVARYQEYRDLKRRIIEQHDQLRHYQSEQQKSETELATLLKGERELALDVRRQMRENGFPEERKYDSAHSALRAYRIRSAQWRSRRSRAEVLQEKLAALNRGIEQDTKDLAKYRGAFEARLKKAGVTSVDEWHARADDARDYREWWSKRKALEEQLESVLRGQSLDDLRAQIAEAGPVEVQDNRSAADIRRELEDVAEAVDACQKREHALHLQITERTAGARSLNEIDEERAVMERRVTTLEFELQAASYAMMLIEEVAQNRHAQIAPRLAEKASRYLSEITGGAYSELFISRDLQVSVRIPETQVLKDDPERRLSKGTVDQIYFALRLALVQSLTDNSESVPMLLDDPFANYDDHRLGRTMHLLNQVAERNQVLLFTCREDVVEAATREGVPVLQL